MIQDNSTDELDEYLRLFAPYEQQLIQFTGREGEYGSRFALLFRQVLRMLVRPLVLNERMPRLFIEVAHRYLENDPDTVKHFSYEDNRHFFLSDLYKWIQVHERGRSIRTGTVGNLE